MRSTETRLTEFPIRKGSFGCFLQILLKVELHDARALLMRDPFQRPDPETVTLPPREPPSLPRYTRPRARVLRGGSRGGLFFATCPTAGSRTRCLRDTHSSRVRGWI